MKKFILKLLLFTTICFGIISYVLIVHGGAIDFFYEKVSTPKATSMIIGDSRALQGIQPAILNHKFNENNIDKNMFNYSFTITQAAFGELYTQSILKKLRSDIKNEIFIISVTPYMFGTNIKNNGTLREEKTPPHNMTFVSMSPNIEYFIKNFNYFHFKGIFKKSAFLHKDGWLEESNLPKDKVIFESWKNKQKLMLNKFNTSMTFSKYRYKEFENLLNILTQKGDIYIVRLPVDQDIIQLEDKFLKTFNDRIFKSAKKYNSKYVNFNKSKKKYETYDGHHLNKYSGKLLSSALADTIIKYNTVK